MTSYLGEEWEQTRGTVTSYMGEDWEQMAYNSKFALWPCSSVSLSLGLDAFPATCSYNPQATS